MNKGDFGIVEAMLYVDNETFYQIDIQKLYDVLDTYNKLKTYNYTDKDWKEIIDYYESVIPRIQNRLRKEKLQKIIKKI